MKINIDVKKKRKRIGKKTKQRPRFVNYKLETFEEEVSVLHIAFFDGSTMLDPDSPGGPTIDTIPEYSDGVEITNNYEVNVVTGVKSSWCGGAWKFNFTQNERSVPDAASILEQYWGPDVNGGKKTILSKTPLKITDEKSIKDNNDVFPVGTSYPNIKVSLLSGDGTFVVEQTDLLSIYTATETNNALVLDDPQEEDNTLGYTWYGNKQFDHIRVEEITSAAHYTIADGNYWGYAYFGPLYLPTVWQENWDPLRGMHEVNYIEGIFWNWFDTSDSQNFKITRDATYGAEEVPQNTTVIMMDKVKKKIRLYLTPRPWLSFFRFSVDFNDKLYGIFRCPPKDLMLPRARTFGEIEVDHDLMSWGGPDVTIWTGGLGDRLIAMANDNAFCKVRITGDTQQLSGFHILHKADSGRSTTFGTQDYYENNGHCTAFLRNWCEGKIPILQQYYTAPGIQYFTTGTRFNVFGKRYDSSFILPTGWNTVYFSNGEVRVFGSGGFWGSAPDGKLPIISGRAELVRKEPGKPDLIRDYGYFDPNDRTLYPTDEVLKITQLRQYFLESQAYPGQKTDMPDSWLLGVAGAKTGDLVGVIEQDDELLFVWRRTDEDFPYKGPRINQEGATVTYDDLLLGSQAHKDAFGPDAGLQLSIPGCLEVFQTIPANAFADALLGGYVDANHNGHFFGHIEYEEAVDQHAWDILFKTPRCIPKIRYWGAYQKWPVAPWQPTFSGGYVDNWGTPIYENPHRQQIDLGVFVRPMFYEHYTPKKFQQRIPETVVWIP
jgi:hypothetical protein